MLMSKVIFIWTSCCAFLFLLILKLDEIVSWNWFIIFIPMWSFDFMLFITSILYMSRKFTHIIGQHNVEGRFNQTLTLSFILWKSIAQIILCLSLEGYLTTLLDSFSQSNVINQNTTSNQTGSSTAVKTRLVYAIFPIWTTMVVCLLIVCTQIVNPRLTGIWSFCSNNQPFDGHRERGKQQKTNVLRGFVTN
ncbi:uncharacterized protein DC041_0008807 [Schistosoma bovis]|uniref:Transmembrane protein 60 n=1 Tax=Schistosoma bovis TaxID=6184 RepID=A0A430QKW8_SCHBO|nr:uncharacterized protein DC041_0008807 [Schistosoma bovis]